MSIPGKGDKFLVVTMNDHKILVSTGKETQAIQDAEIFIDEEMKHNDLVEVIIYKAIHLYRAKTIVEHERL